MIFDQSYAERLSGIHLGGARLTRLPSPSGDYRHRTFEMDVSVKFGGGGVEGIPGRSCKWGKFSEFCCAMLGYVVGIMDVRGARPGKGEKHETSLATEKNVPNPPPVLCLVIIKLLANNSIGRTMYVEHHSTPQVSSPLLLHPRSSHGSSEIELPCRTKGIQAFDDDVICSKLGGILSPANKRVE